MKILSEPLLPVRILKDEPQDRGCRRMIVSSFCKNNNPMKGFLFPAILALLLPLPQAAQANHYATVPADTPVVISGPAFSGRIRGLAWGGAENCPLGAMFGEIGLKSGWRRNHLVMEAEVRIREGVFTGEHKTVVDLREAWAGYRSEKVDLALGNQIVTWGKTDGFNPTNHITPVNYFLLTDDPMDQKMAAFMLRGTFRPLRGISLSALAIPSYKPSVYRFDLFEMGEGTSFLPAMAPAMELKNGSYAARAEFSLPGADFSLSWTDGFAPEYGFTVDSISPFPSTVIQYRPAYHRRKMAGFDLAVPAGKMIFRAEAAWQCTEGYEDAIYIPRPGLNYVAGIEADIYGIKTIAQYIGVWTHDFTPLQEPVLLNPADPLAQLQYASDKIWYESGMFNRRIFFQQEETNHAVSLSLIRSFLYETFTAEATGYYNLTSEEAMARLALAWLPADGLKITLGGQFLDGPDNTLFYHAGKILSGAFLGMQVSF